MVLLLLSVMKAVASVLLCSVVLASCNKERRSSSAHPPVSLSKAILTLSCILMACVIGHWLALFMSDLDITSVSSLVIITVDVIQMNLCGISFGYYASSSNFRDFAYAFSIIALIVSTFGAFL